MIALRAAWLAVLTALGGTAAGLGTYTFFYAEGASYLSSDPTVCANCHIMQEHYDAWRAGGHHAAARCVDCHLPHTLAGKYIAKSLNGYHHSKAFTTQNFQEPIKIKPMSARIVQDNCIRCHADMASNLVLMGRADPDYPKCAHCHARVGHDF